MLVSLNLQVEEGLAADIVHFFELDGHQCRPASLESIDIVETGRGVYVDAFVPVAAVCVHRVVHAILGESSRPRERVGVGACV